MSLTVLQGDCRDVLPTLPTASVQCVATSPPYLGLRDYGTAQWDGGDPACDHARIVQPRNSRPLGLFHGGSDDGDYAREKQYRSTCGKCGAVRIDNQIGFESLHDCLAWARHEPPCDACYVCTLRTVARELWRVLREDGTFWLNLGSSFASRRVADHDGTFVLRDDLTVDEQTYVLAELSTYLSHGTEVHVPDITVGINQAVTSLASGE